MSTAHQASGCHGLPVRLRSTTTPTPMLAVRLISGPLRPIGDSEHPPALPSLAPASPSPSRKLRNRCRPGAFRYSRASDDRRAPCRATGGTTLRRFPAILTAALLLSLPAVAQEQDQ